MPVRPSGGTAAGGDNGHREEGSGRRGDEPPGLPPRRPKTLSKLTDELLGYRSASRTAESPWKTRFEDADRKRKQLMALAHKGNQDLEDLKECYRKLKEQYDAVCQQSKEKDEKMEELKKASKSMYHEYEKLNNQYNEETGAYQEAMKHATSWYKENQELKRRSMVLTQRFMKESPEISMDILAEEMKINSSSYQDNKELEDLKKSIKDLSETVGRLQSELNAARLEEFEAQEAVAAISGELEECMAAYRSAETEAKKAWDEVKALHKVAEEAAEEARNEGHRADAALRDRNTMAHQSALLLSQALEEDYEGRMAAALMEIEAIKKELEEERIAHTRKIKEMEEKLEKKDAEARLELAEEQLRETSCRAEEAERKLVEFEQRVKQLEGDLETSKKETGTSQLPPPPPPPPPIPSPLSQLVIPPPPSFAYEKPINQPTTIGDNYAIKENIDTRASQKGAADQGGCLTKNKCLSNATQGAAALDEIINQIKGGRFTLRNTEKRRLRYIGNAEQADDKPPAVKEMLGILGTLRRRPGLAGIRNGAGECPQSNGMD